MSSTSRPPAISTSWIRPWPPLAPHGARAPLGLLCPPPERIHEFSGWDTAYVRDTVVVLSPDAGTTALGSAFGTREQINARLWESVRACDELRSAINGVDHAPTELVLTRQCADVSKLMYQLRINGDILDHDLFASFDGQLRASVSNSLCGDLPDHSWWQATRCVGWRPGATHGRDCGSARPSCRAASYLVPSWSPWWILSARPLGPLVKRSWRSTTHVRTKPYPVLLPHPADTAL